MPTENSLNSRHAERGLLALGVLACLYFHLRGLSAMPGLHYDEAWAMNYSWRIGFEPGFWPWQAMSPYTAPWAHYWAALWMKLFSPSLLVFRLSQVALSLSAIFLFTHELFRMGQRRAAAFFPLAVVFLPGLLLNHRFAIELNGLHPFLFALLFAALARGRVAWAAAFWVIGSTGHILFYAVGLSLLAACLWEKREFSSPERRAISLASAALGLFFLRVFFSVPEKGKAAALVISALALIAIMEFPRARRALDYFPRWSYLPAILGAVFFVNLVFFAEGTWTTALFTGVASWEADPRMLFLFPPLFAWLAWKQLEKTPALLRNWFWFGLVLLGLMMLKPAPRYFEIPLFALALLLASALANRPRRQIWLGCAALSLHAGLIYFSPLSAPPKEAELHLFFYKDSSRDFLAKQKLAQFLGGVGCGLNDIKSVDSRVGEALLALSREDWQIHGGPCPWNELSVTRSKESGTQLPTIADFVLEGKAADGT
ncbi:MAG: hypothetical protein AB7K68_14040 [Bacteriovoracia bacterium]